MGVLMHIRDDIEPVVGDVVATYDAQLGVVTEIRPDSYIVWTSEGHYRTHSRPYHDVVVCPNCGYARSVHAVNGKCLYGPGNWGYYDVRRP